MKKFNVVFFIFIFQTNFGFGQIVYLENFGNGCTTGTLATTFGWTNTNTGVNQATANIWYVSANENGVGAGNCGVGCGGANSRTLHVSAAAAAGGDLGAAYFESSALFCTFFGLCSVTNKRIESPTINCTGISTISFTFDYIENGEGLTDNATVWYSANNGVTWSQIDDPPKSTLCGAQGLWSTRSLTLPASADNNPTIKIGFLWVNNGNGIATDPSFAVDNIQVGIPIILPVEMVEMKASCSNSGQTISWKTKSELNADYYAVYKSRDKKNWSLLAKIKANNSSKPSDYSVEDNNRTNEIIYYYIEQVDFDGHRKSYTIFSSEKCEFESGIVVYPNPSDGGELNIVTGKNKVQQIEIYSMDNKIVYRFINEDENNSELLRINPDLAPGRYLLRVFTSSGAEVISLIIS